MAIGIGKELDQQNILLNEFENKIDGSSSRLGILLLGMQKLLKGNNKCYLALACCLTVTLGVEIFIYMQVY